MAAGVIKTVAPYGAGAGRFLREINRHNISNEYGILAANAAAYPSGTVLGRLTANQKLVPYDPAAGTGAQTFAGILYADIDISAVDTRVTYVARTQLVNLNQLNFVNALNTGQVATLVAAMAAVGIIARA